MQLSQDGRGMQTETSSEPLPTSRHSNRGVAALVPAVFAAGLMWVALVVTPWIMRDAVSRGDYGNVFTVPAILWGVVLVLHAVALTLGLTAVRQTGAKAKGGAAIAIGASGILGITIYLVGTLVVLPVIS
jgi:hypothetical protein